MAVRMVLRQVAMVAVVGMSIETVGDLLAGIRDPTVSRDPLLKLLTYVLLIGGVTCGTEVLVTQVIVDVVSEGCWLVMILLTGTGSGTRFLVAHLVHQTQAFRTGRRIAVDLCAEVVPANVLQVAIRVRARIRDRAGLVSRAGRRADGRADRVPEHALAPAVRRRVRHANVTSAFGADIRDYGRERREVSTRRGLVVMRGGNQATLVPVEVIVRVAVHKQMLWIDANRAVALSSLDFTAKVFDHMALPCAGLQNLAAGGAL